MRGSLLLALYSWHRSDKLHLRLSSFLVSRSTSGIPVQQTTSYIYAEHHQCCPVVLSHSDTIDFNRLLHCYLQRSVWR